MLPISLFGKGQFLELLSEVKIQSTKQLNNQKSARFKTTTKRKSSLAQGNQYEFKATENLQLRRRGQFRAKRLSNRKEGRREQKRNKSKKLRKDQRMKKWHNFRRKVSKWSQKRKNQNQRRRGGRIGNKGTKLKRNSRSDCRRPNAESLVRQLYKKCKDAGVCMHDGQKIWESVNEIFARFSYVSPQLRGYITRKEFRKSFMFDGQKLTKNTNKS